MALNVFKFTVALPKWANMLLESIQEVRTARKNIVLDWLMRGGFRLNPTTKGQAIVKMLENKEKFTLIGFVPAMYYIRETPLEDGSGMRNLFEHPLGSETLAYYSEEDHYIVVINPGLRYDETVLNELKDPRIKSPIRQNLAGISG